MIGIVDNYHSISLESEMTWNNIMEEFLYDNNLFQETVLINESFKDTIVKVLEWIQNKFIQLKRLFKDLLSKIIVQTKGIDRFIKKNKSEIISCKKDITVEAYDWNTFLSRDILVDGGNLITSITKFEKQKNSISNSCKNVNDVIKHVLNYEPSTFKQDIESKYRSSNKSEITIKYSSLPSIVYGLENYKSSVKNIIDIRNNVIKFLEEFNSACKSILKLFESNKELKEGQKKLITSGKACISTSEKVCAIYISIASQQTLDSLKICKKALKLSKKEK